jgi:hypothetical protein
VNEQEVIWQHLTLYKRTASGVWTSSFLAALRDARGASKRNPRTGAKHRNANHGSWLGTLTYLIFLDQVGKSFKPLGEKRLFGNPI